MKDYTQLVGLVMRTAPGTPVEVTIVRAKKPLTMTVTIEAFDAERQLAQQNEAEPPVAAATPTDTGLDMTIGAVTPDVARQRELQEGRKGEVVREVDPRGVAVRRGT